MRTRIRRPGERSPRHAVRWAWIALLLMSTAAPGARADAPALELVGQIGGSAKAVAVAGSRAYVGLGPRLVALDISDADAPVVLGQSAVLPDVVESVVVSGTLAYLADGYADLVIMDISDPTRPVQIGALDMKWFSTDVAVAGHRAYVMVQERGGYDDTGLYVLDVVDPARPRVVGRYMTAGDAEGVAVAATLSEAKK